MNAIAIGLHLIPILLITAFAVLCFGLAGLLLWRERRYQRLKRRIDDIKGSGGQPPARPRLFRDERTQR
jgi:uncharacterized iron-regulated membrane protein